MHSAIVDHPVDISALIERVSGTTNGAVVLFVGNVRDVNDGREVRGIEYTAYRSMAARELASIVEEAALLGDTNDVAVEHRLGELNVGDCSVAIAVGHPYRGRAFETARYVIEELKRRVPIWKREHYVDGTREWVSAAPGSSEQLPDIGDER